MLIPLSYVVEERNRVGIIRSCLVTRDPYVALGDWLLKSHKPIGFPPNCLKNNDAVKFEITHNIFPDSSDFICMSGRFTLDGSEVRSFAIRTQVLKKESSLGYSDESSKIYLRKEYSAAIKKIRDRLERFSEGSIDAAYLLALFASRDALHLFWNNKLSNSKLEYR